jgi:hypothetical protein
VGGLVVPAVDPGAAWDAAAGLSSVARSAQAAADALSAAPASAICWSGSAADAYRGIRERLARRTIEVAEVASAAAGVVLDWVRDAAPALAVMRSGAERVQQAQRRLALLAAGSSAGGVDAGGVGGGGVVDAGVVAALHAEVTAGYRQWEAGRQGYADAARTATSRFMALRDGISDRPLGVTDQAVAATRTAWDGYVVSGVTAGWALTGLVVSDPGAWWSNVRGAPGQAVEGIAGVVMDPKGTAAAAVDADAWADGRYGEAAASMAVMFLPGPRWLKAFHHDGPARFAANLADPAASRPILQTIDELINGVDLDRHEHAELGHTLRRHVHVDHDYLMDRLTHGTLLDEGGRGSIPSKASRFTDRATAERVLTDALHQHQLELSEFTHQPVGSFLQIEYPTSNPIGEVMIRAPGGGFKIQDARHLSITVKIGPDGPFIYTAFAK